MAPRLSNREFEEIMDKGLLQTHAEQRQRITELERSNAILHTAEEKLSVIEDEIEIVRAELAEKSAMVESLQRKLAEEREKRRGLGKGASEWKERCEVYERRWHRIRKLVIDEEDVKEALLTKTPVTISSVPALPFTLPEPPVLLPSSLPRRALATRKPTPHVSDISSPISSARRKRVREDVRVREEVSTRAYTPPRKRSAPKPVTPASTRSIMQPIHVKDEISSPKVSRGYVIGGSEDANEDEDEEDPLAMM